MGIDINHLSVGFAPEYVKIKEENPWTKREKLVKAWDKALKKEQKAFKAMSDYEKAMEAEVEKWKVEVEALRKKAITIHDSMAIVYILD